MNLIALRDRLAELYPGSDPLTPTQVSDAMATLRDETETVTQPTRITLLSVANSHGNTVADNLSQALNTQAETSVYVREIIELLRNGNGVDISHAAAQQMIDKMVLDGLISESDATAIKDMANHDVPRWPGVTVSKIKQARAL